MLLFTAGKGGELTFDVTAKSFKMQKPEPEAGKAWCVPPAVLTCTNLIARIVIVPPAVLTPMSLRAGKLYLK